MKNQCRFSISRVFPAIAHNGLGLCVVALTINLKLTTTLDRAITQNPCYVPLNFKANVQFIREKNKVATISCLQRKRN